MSIATEPVCSEPVFVERLIDAGGERMRVREAGQGEPLLVLCDDAGAEPGIAESILAKARRVIMVELPGPPRHAGAALAAVIAALQYEQVALLASSLTTPAALWLAIEFPERIQSIVLESPLAFSTHVPSLGGRSEEAFKRGLNAHPDRKVVLRAVHAAAFATRARQWIGPTQDQTFAEKLAAFDSPVLTLFGTRDTLTPVELGRFYKTLVPNCWFVMIYDAAHDIRGDRPEAFAEVVGDFLRRGAQFAIGERSSRLNR